MYPQLRRPHIEKTLQIVWENVSNGRVETEQEVVGDEGGGSGEEGDGDSGEEEDGDVGTGQEGARPQTPPTPPPTQEQETYQVDCLIFY